MNHAAVCAAVAILIAAQSAPVVAAVPSVTHVFPPGGQRGTTVSVTFKGKFDWPVKVDAPGATAEVTSDKGVVRLTIPNDLAADRIWLRAFNDEGALTSVPFEIGSLPELNEQEPNNTAGNAHKVPVGGCTVNGVLEKSEVDAFAVELTSGQTLVAAVDANTRLGSPIDAILQIATPDGFVLAENHDALGLDPRLAFTAPKDGLYLVRLFAFPSNPNSTIAFFGSETSIYRLTLTTGAFVVYPVPQIIDEYGPLHVELVGWNLTEPRSRAIVPWARTPRGTPLEFEPFNPVIPSASELAMYVLGGRQFSTRMTRVAFQNANRGADDTSDLKLALPSIVTGRFHARTDVHACTFALEKDQELVATAEEQSLGQPHGLILRLTDSQKNSVANWDDLNQKKPTPLRYTAKASGEYRLEVRPRRRPGAERSDYELHVAVQRPDFEIEIKDETIAVSKDKPTEVPLTIRRLGTGLGPITIEVRNLPEGVTAEPVTSEPSGATSGKVTIKLTSAGKAWSGPIQFIGRTTQPGEISHEARTSPRLGVSFGQIWLTAVASKEQQEPAGKP